MAAMLDDPGLLLLLAEFDGLTAGYLHRQFLDRLDRTRQLLIYDAAIAAEHRRKGVGTALMRSAFSHGRTEGAASCWLIADERNATGTAFYESLDGTAWPAVRFRWELT